jgi:hypothetical protein
MAVDSCSSKENEVRRTRSGVRWGLRVFGGLGVFGEGPPGREDLLRAGRQAPGPVAEEAP